MIFRLTAWKALQFRIDMLNAFNLVNFDGEDSVSNTTLANWEVDSANSGRVIQLVTRFSTKHSW